MKPLVFLMSRSFVNYCRRAKSSPQRLIGLLMIVGYWFFAFGRNVINVTGGPSGNRPSHFQRLDGPSFTLSTAEAAIFWLFVFLSLMLFLGSLNPRGSFRAADIDVLFPTPVSQKAVLVFRMLRDGLTTLIFPLFFAVVLLARPSSNQFAALIRGFPDGGGAAIRLFALAYVLSAVCFVTVGYAASLFVHRDDDGSGRNRRGFNIAVSAVILSAIAYVGYRQLTDPGFETMVAVSHLLPIRLVFLIPSAATAMVLAPLKSSPVEGAIGLGVLLAVIGGAVKLSLAQIGFLYDQAAQRAARVPVRSSQQRGDVYAQAAELVRQGKGRSKRRLRLLSKWTPHGAATMIWKDLILQSRGAVGAYVVVGVMSLAIVLILSPQALATAPLIATALAGWMFGQMASNAGFVELLRRGDLQKPLPFSSTLIITLEVLAKVIPIVVISAVVALVGCVLNPASWDAAIASVVTGPSLSMCVLSVGVLVMLFFPDADDAAQRSFRSFMTLLGSLIASAPAIGIAVVMSIFHLSPLLIVIPVLALSVGVSAIAVTFAGGLYASFNPQE